MITVGLQNKTFLNIRKAVTQKIISTRTARALLVKQKYEILLINGEHLLDIALLSKRIQKRIDLHGQEEIEIEPGEDKISEIEFVLSFAYSSDPIWKKFLPNFREMFLTEEQRIVLAKTYSFAHSILGFSEHGYQLKEIFCAYKNLSPKLTLSNFACANYNYFTAKLKQFRELGIEKCIVNANTGVVRLTKKVSKLHQKYLVKYYAHPARYKYRKIKELVNHDIIKLGMRPISLSSVKMFLRQPEIQNTYKPFRLGRKWAQDTLYPYLVREKPRKNNYQWQSDSTCLNFYVYDGSGNVGRRWLCLVVDVKSRKILASGLDKYETSDLVVHTLMKAVLKYRVIPFELVHDNSAAYRSDRMKEVESKMEELGGYVRLTEPENPKDKGCIEAIWGILQIDYFRNEKGYLGDGVRSFTEEGRVDPALKSEYFRGIKSGIWNESELYEMVQNKIEMFNNRQI